MDNQREKFINEMLILKKALEKTKSQYLINDYTKKLNKMKKELREYDTYKGYAKRR